MHARETRLKACHAQLLQGVAFLHSRWVLHCNLHLSSCHAQLLQGVAYCTQQNLQPTKSMLCSCCKAWRTCTAAVVNWHLHLSPCHVQLLQGLAHLHSCWMTLQDPQPSSKHVTCSCCRAWRTCTAATCSTAT